MRRRYIQDPKTGKLIPAEEYRRADTVHAVHGDIDEFRSHVDGSVISSRRDLREHNKRHGVVTGAEYGNDNAASVKAREDFYGGRPHDTKRRLDAIRFAFETETGNYTKAEKRQMAENYRRQN